MFILFSVVIYEIDVYLQQGFEARGTVIGNRLVAWENLLEATRGNGPLIVNPGGDPRFQPTTAIPYDGPPTSKPVHRHMVIIFFQSFVS